ncbi:uncharacterized protein A4U43_C07F6760 [Asparagus officinalis]|uniref:Uncharacterized protein n=1 Tax=Asparagus officinalis TaxID=4686 RepID=A0A5P1ED84_ASPOF|nr:uncharacterized protein A4U43_C07F6760 [Asparagus officinalis]
MSAVRSPPPAIPTRTRIKSLDQSFKDPFRSPEEVNPKNRSFSLFLRFQSLNLNGEGARADVRGGEEGGGCGGGRTRSAGGGSMRRRPQKPQEVAVSMDILVKTAGW